jgi:hypothetical protein
MPFAKNQVVTFPTHVVNCTVSLVRLSGSRSEKRVESRRLSTLPKSCPTRLGLYSSAEMTLPRLAANSATFNKLIVRRAAREVARGQVLAGTALG